jgi:hypothetical protein
VNTKSFVVQDPREFDGDPYQVAERAIRQLRGVLEVAETLVDPTNLMLRNAELERQLALGNKLVNPAAEWPESPQGRAFAKIADEVTLCRARLQSLEKAAAYNPKAR